MRNFYKGKRNIIIALALAAFFFFLLVFAVSRPALAKLLYKEGRKKFAQGNYLAAVNDFREAANLDSSKAEYFAYTAYAYHQRKDERAEDYYKKALSLHYQTPIFFYSLGLFYETMKKDDQKAIAYYKKAIETQKSGYNAAYGRLINLLVLNKREREAVPVAENLVEKYPKPSSYSLLGIVYSKNGEFEKAKLSFEKAMEMDPGNATWPARLGRTFLSEGKVSEAISELEKALSIDPSNEEALCTLAYIYTSKKPNYQKAISYGQEVVKKEESGKRVNRLWLKVCLYNLGEAYSALGEKDLAKKSFGEFLEIAPKNPNDYFVKTAREKLRKLF